jgi:hypothetical protein
LVPKATPKKVSESCKDVPPPGPFSCAEQAGWGQVRCLLSRRGFLCHLVRTGGWLGQYAISFPKLRLFLFLQLKARFDFLFSSSGHWLNLLGSLDCPMKS